MSRQDALIGFIREALLGGASDDAVTADAELLTTGLIDSLGLMRLIAFIREEFGTDVPYEDILIENFRTVRCIDDYLTNRPAGVAG